MRFSYKSFFDPKTRVQVALRTLQLYIFGVSWDIEISKTAFESSSKILTKHFGHCLAQVKFEVTRGQKVNFEKKIVDNVIDFKEQRFWQHRVCLVKACRNIYDMTLKGKVKFGLRSR